MLQPVRTKWRKAHKGRIHGTATRASTINYGAYQNLEGGYFPSDFRIIATQKEEKTQIVVNYKKIDYNVSIRFPFTIPNGYEEMQLN